MANTIKNPRSNDAVIGGQPHQILIKELDLMLRARYPLVYIVSAEEDPIEEVLNSVAAQSNSDRQILTWDLVRGWDDNGSGKGNVMDALNRIAKAEPQESSIFVLRDLHYILKNPETGKNPPVIREIKNLTKELKRSRKTLILTSHTLAIPEEFKEEVTVIDFPLPNTQEIDYLISQLVVPEKLKVEGKSREQLIKACQGLSRARSAC